MLDWLKVEGGAGRMAASGDDVSMMLLHGVDACTDRSSDYLVRDEGEGRVDGRALGAGQQKRRLAQCRQSRRDKVEDKSDALHFSCRPVLATKSTSIGGDHLGCTCREIVRVQKLEVAGPEL
jgi:hypothetical protein